MSTKKERMYQRIEEHGNQLNAIFNTGLDAIALCKKLRIIERKQDVANTDYCNGYISCDQFNTIKNRTRKRILKLLGDNVPIIINSDPRGYALKIDDAFMYKHQPKLMRDWGGFGIIAPDLSED